MTFHYRLIELEAERVAKEQSSRGLETFPVECGVLLQYVQRDVEIKLADVVPKDWQGWISYARNQQSLVICRGRAFKIGGAFGKHRAGLDVPNGMDSVADVQRGFDVSPPQDLDHLLLNFGGESPKCFLWYGENIAPYKLIYEAEVASEPHKELSDAIVEACTWIMKRPKHQTLNDFLSELDAQNRGR